LKIFAVAIRLCI